MKTLIETKTAKQAVKFVAGFVPRRTTLPILANVHLYSNGHFEMMSTDLDVTLIARCPSQTVFEGKTTLPDRALLDAVSGKENAFELSADAKDVATIRLGAVSRIINGLPAGEFPPVPACNVPTSAPCPDVQPLTVPRTFRTDAAQFVAALKTVCLAISTAESRYVLNGVCMELSADSARLVATDGRRIHVAEMSRAEVDMEFAARLNAVKAEIADREKALNFAELTFPSAAGGIEAKPEVIFARAKLQEAKDKQSAIYTGGQYILPTLAVKQLLRLPLDRTPREMVFTFWQNRIETSEKKIEFTPFARIDCGAYSIVSKLVEGNFPHWRQVVPLEFKETVRLDLPAFRAALIEAEKVTSDRSNSVKLDFAENLLTVHASTPDVGQISVPLPIQYSGKPFSIAFNPRYLIEICDSFKGSPEVEANFIDELSPGTFKAGGSFAVVMPMRLS